MSRMSTSGEGWLDIGKSSAVVIDDEDMFAAAARAFSDTLQDTPTKITNSSLDTSAGGPSAEGVHARVMLVRMVGGM